MNPATTAAFSALVGAWLGAFGCGGTTVSLSNDPESYAGGPTATGSSGAIAGGGDATIATGGSSAIGGSAGTTGADSWPPCPPVNINADPVNRCFAEDPQICYRICGPGSVGYKLHACINGSYQLQSSCVFPSTGDYGCLAVPTADSTACPITEPQHGQACSLPLCGLSFGSGCTDPTSPCGICGVATGYADASGSSKTGYCVCIAASNGGGKWSCAGDFWPCPEAPGC